MKETPCKNCKNLVEVYKNGAVVEYRCRVVNEELDPDIAEGIDVDLLPSCSYYKSGRPALIEISPGLLNSSSRVEPPKPRRTWKWRRKNKKPKKWNSTRQESWQELIEIIQEYKISSDRPPTPPEIIKASRYAEKSRAYVYQLLSQMEEAGMIKRVEIDRTNASARLSRVGYDLV